MTPLRYLVCNGLRLAVYGAAGDGPPLVFQHGLGGDARQIAEAMQGIGGQSWHGIECAGHGASELGPEISIVGFADDVAALIETLPHPVVLGGISMGAAIASRLAVMRPDLVRALVLVRPAWVTDAAPANMAPNAEVGRLLADHPANEAAAIFAKGATARRLASESPDNLASLMGFFLRKPQADTARLLTAISADGPRIGKDDLRALRLPALICGTSEDAVHPMAHAIELATLIPQARLADLPPKGRDKPAHLAALAAAMSRFLKEI
ncbi:MAG: alpha/beta hydrolase [Rhodobacteraceae bacterium]|nr:alpha/beta hydrolase [Paracoccaceae bacterium]MCF8521121.1 alpha/beta hydrolase [Paracoccaceae bacterium]